MSKHKPNKQTLYQWLKALDAIGKETKEEELINLQRLDLSNKKLDSLHDDIGLLQNLSYLNVSSNELKSLPESFSSLSKLLSLNLRRNHLHHLPLDIQSLELRSLNISANKIEDVSFLASFTQLRIVDLSNNFLHSINGIFDHASKLRRMNVESNLLTKCSFHPQTLSELEILNLSDNRLVLFPTNVEELDGLTTLNLSNNSIDDDLNKLNALELETLDLSSNSLKTVNLQGFSELKNLILDDNAIENIDIENTFAPKLTSFSAEGCGLKAFIILGSKELVYLSLSSNEIETIPDTIGLYTSLHELDIDDNKISHLPQSFENLSALKSLYINGNSLDEISRKRIADRHIEYCDIFVKKDILIRRALFNDIQQMAKLLAQLFAIEADFAYDYAKHLKALKFMYDNKHGDLLVAKYRNRVVGMVTLQELVSTAEGGIVGQLEDLVVDSGFRKMGVGTRLVREVFNLARERSYSRIQLAADKDNYKALRFYRQRGFNLSNLSIYHYVGIQS